MSTPLDTHYNIIYAEVYKSRELMPQGEDFRCRETRERSTETRATTRATRTALMVGTLTTLPPLLNGVGGGLCAHAAARPGSPTAKDSPQ